MGQGGSIQSISIRKDSQEEVLIKRSSDIEQKCRSHLVECFFKCCHGLANLYRKHLV